MIRFLVLFLILLTTPAFAVSQWDKTLPSSGANLTAWPAAVQAQWSILDTLLANYRYGEIITYKNSTTLTVTTGQVVVSNSGASLRVFLTDAANTDITTANLDSGASFSAGTTYYVYAATSSATAASSTYYISLNSTLPTGPTYYTQLGSFTTDGSGNVSAAAIVNNSNPIVLASQNSIYNMRGRTISNGFLGQTSSSTVSTPTAGSFTVPAGCYMTGIRKDGAGLPDQLIYSCP